MEGYGLSFISSSLLPPARLYNGTSNRFTLLESCFSRCTAVPGSTLSSIALLLNSSKQILHGQPRLAGCNGIRCEVGSVSTTTSTEWLQKTIELPVFRRGCHIITQHINRAVPEISEFHVGIAHIFVMHTSASLTINENASFDVPLDMEDSLNRIVPEGHHYRHLDEGLDDMPAHVKASMMGSSLTIPIRSGRLHLGIWQIDRSTRILGCWVSRSGSDVTLQIDDMCVRLGFLHLIPIVTDGGIWLNEHRNYGGSRSICITIQGQKRGDGRVYK